MVDVQSYPSTFWFPAQINADVHSHYANTLLQTAEKSVTQFKDTLEKNPYAIKVCKQTATLTIGQFSPTQNKAPATLDHYLRSTDDSDTVLSLSKINKDNYKPTNVASDKYTEWGSLQVLFDESKIKGFCAKAKNKHPLLNQVVLPDDFLIQAFVTPPSTNFIWLSTICYYLSEFRIGVWFDQDKPDIIVELNVYMSSNNVDPGKKSPKPADTYLELKPSVNPVVFWGAGRTLSDN
jgi:hypothetical protein